MHSSVLLLATAPGRQRLADFALRFAHGTPLDPDPYERRRLSAFVRGEVTIDQLEAQLAARPAPAVQRAAYSRNV